MQSTWVFYLLWCDPITSWNTEITKTLTKYCILRKNMLLIKHKNTKCRETESYLKFYSNFWNKRIVCTIYCDFEMHFLHFVIQIGVSNCLNDRFQNPHSICSMFNVHDLMSFYAIFCYSTPYYKIQQKSRFDFRHPTLYHVYFQYSYLFWAFYSHILKIKFHYFTKHFNIRIIVFKDT